MILTLILSCAPQGTGLSILVNSDEIYEPTLAKDIKLFSEMPDSSIQIIALIKGYCASYLDEKKNLPYALEGLKNEAAQIGAHGVIINSPHLINDGGLFAVGPIPIGSWANIHYPVIEGKAFRYTNK